MKKVHNSLSGLKSYYLKKLLLTMKIFAFLFLNLLNIHAITYSQSEKLNFKLNRAPLKEMFTEIEKQTNYKFLYRDDILENTYISITANNSSLAEVLNKALVNSSNAYKILDNNLIVISPKEYFQKRTITGRVIDIVSGDPLPGVNIVVAGTTIGTITDVDGRYSLEILGNDAVLEFSFVGYLAEKVTVGEKTTIDISLSQDIKNLEEIVVVGYGTQKRGTVTGAVSSINNEALTSTPSTTTSGALVGKVQGITSRATDARPGNGTNIQIRNLGAPLFVIDGIPYGGLTGTTSFGFTQGSGQDVFNTLGLEDIESITILKDASAAIYGLRAANGVVLVTTKKGKKGEKPTINVSGYYGVQNFTRYPQPANAGQFVRGLVESEQNLGNNPALLYTPEELAKWEAGTEKGYKSYDYLKIVTRKNVPQYYITANTTGGTERTNYYISVSHLDQDAMLPDFTYQRNNVQANIQTNLLQGLKVGTEISLRLDKTHNVGVPGLDDYFNPFLSIFSMWPTESPYANDNPKYINQTHNVNVNPATYKDDVTGYVDEQWRAINANLYAQYDFKFGLSVKGTYSHNYSNEDFDGFEYTYNAYKYDPATDSYLAQPGYGNQNPWRERHKRNITSRFAQLQLSYNKTFGDHSISAITAYERSDYDNTYLVLHAVPKNNYVSLMNFAEQDYLADYWDMEARAGYIGRFNYNYKQKYLLEILGRYDGSYLYDPDSRWGFFPGVSVGWKISEESFLKDKLGDILTDLKIRASYGETGSEIGISNFGYLAGYNYYSGNAVLDGNYVIGLRPRGIPIKNLSWVKNRTKNIGLDFGMFKNKLTGQIDIFERKRTGLPAARYDVLLPSEVGYSLPNENLNSDATRGIEGLITYSDKIGDFNYTLSANATISRLRLLRTYKPRFGNSWDEYRNSIEDRWEKINWGYHVIGRFQSQEQIDNYDVDNDRQGNRTLLPGDFMYEDVNGDKIINNMDERPIGYAEGAQPYMSYGINGNFSWKGISLGLYFSGATMQSYLRDWEMRYPFQNNGSAPAYMLTDRWHREDPYDPNSRWISGTYPATRKNNTSHSNYWRNDFWVTNVHYFRLKNIELGYELPQSIISKVGMTKFRVYVNGTNLFSFDNVKDMEIDPEISSTNGLVYPQQKLVTLGVNMTF
jgi:TonB-linked SusC/RagA family outer membrane protein